MTFHCYADIFPPNYPFLPDEEEVQRQCKAWFYQLLETQTLRSITERIKAIVDPYRREYTVTVMWEHAQQESTNPDSDVRLAPSQLDELEHDLRIICRGARDEQISLENDALQPADTPTTSSPAVTTRLADMEEDIRSLKKDVAQLKKMVLHETQHPHWPTFRPHVTDEQKEEFERFLHKLCTSEKKGLTRDVKCYLKMKAEAGIIVRPDQQNTEYEWVKLFGYPNVEKTYYNS